MSKELDLIERLDALVPSLGSKIATGVTVAGGATASGGQWLLSSDHVAWLGIAVAVAGFIVNWIYKARELHITRTVRMAQAARDAEAHEAEQRRKDEQHRATMDQITGGGHVR
ncbi:holin family protein (superfamily II) [Comamonas sp. BIGb0124]|uniref:hypothetical protein n=1 Tax=Comamonas sp. BIGb0124 TaxID=2485130 RepID=UPI000F48A0BC|nr:hypothetical protein [Comamonas sp. BIGb0124]ROR23050.1 holin family protein (superfamily II) [Comamonas sp. BIGb0124]